jgi:hypothetical protein
MRKKETSKYLAARLFIPMRIFFVFLVFVFDKAELIFALFPDLLSEAILSGDKYNISESKLSSFS